MSDSCQSSTETKFERLVARSRQNAAFQFKRIATRHTRSLLHNRFNFWRSWTLPIRTHIRTKKLRRRYVEADRGCPLEALVHVQGAYNILGRKLGLRPSQGSTGNPHWEPSIIFTRVKALLAMLEARDHWLPFYEASIPAKTQIKNRISQQRAVTQPILLSPGSRYKRNPSRGITFEASKSEPNRQDLSAVLSSVEGDQRRQWVALGAVFQRKCRS